MMGIFYESFNTADGYRQQREKEQEEKAKERSADYKKMHNKMGEGDRTDANKRVDQHERNSGKKYDYADKRHAYDAADRHERRHPQNESVDIWSSIEMK